MIDLNPNNLFPKKPLAIRLREAILGIIGEAISWVGTTLSSEALGLGITWGQVISGVVSIGLTIYSAVRSTGGKAGTDGGLRTPNQIDTNGQLVNTRQSSDPLRVVYGIVKTGGTWLFSKPSRLDNTVLNCLVTWGEGDLNGIHPGIDSSLIYSGSALNDLNTAGQFVYAACSCDMSCYSYGACVTCNMQHD
jgi:hypothetical protein